MALFNVFGESKGGLLVVGPENPLPEQAPETPKAINDPPPPISSGNSGDPCGCPPPNTSPMWTPRPEFREITEILPGENIDCFARRAGNPTDMHDDATDDLVNRVQNTSLSADANLMVNEKFTLSKGPRTATSWKMTPVIPGLSFDSGSGTLSGKVAKEALGKTYKVMLSAQDAEGTIDAREFTLVPEQSKKGEAMHFISPYVSTGSKAGSPMRVTSDYGIRRHPKPPHAQKLHAGMDIADGTGTGKIVAAADGVVIFAGISGSLTSGYGRCVRINHVAANGELIATTVYGHMSSLTVTKGQKVSAGQAIGKEGTTGGSNGNHLHFEILLGGKQNTDPKPYIRGKFIALQPKQIDGTIPPPKEQNKKAASLTQKEVKAKTANDCPSIAGGNAAQPAPTTPEPQTAPVL